MREILTHKAAKVIELAELEAARLKTKRLNSAHMLLGLLIEGTGLGAKALERAGLTLPMIYATLKTEEVEHAKTLSRSDAIRRCLELSSAFGENYIGTEHLLLLIADDDNEEYLTSLGLKGSSLRATVLRLMGKPYSEVGEPYL